MTTDAVRGGQVGPAGVLAAVLVALTLAGCNRTNQETEVDYKPTGTQPKTDEKSPKAALDPRLHRPFKEATLAEPPEGQLLLDKTMAGLSVGKLFYEVREKEWDNIRFATDDGKKLLYTAKFSTALGDIPMELFPEAAPNHVRSFVALARVKYFDGLTFDRVLQVSDVKNPTPVELLVGGDPKGTGEAHYGSIGYYLKPEKNDRKHEPGAVGAFHEESADTAACTFYITLGNAPALDSADALWTVFGRVTPEGLEVAKKIAARPRLNNDPPGRPQQPVVMTRVTIDVREGGPVAAPSADKK
jgi:cyclophilin family peptidyl-prolyl cis-trans isomerase